MIIPGSSLGRRCKILSSGYERELRQLSSIFQSGTAVR